MNEEREKRYCPQCENHCPEDELRCGRGHHYFEEDDMEHNHGEYHERRPGHERHCRRGEGFPERSQFGRRPQPEMPRRHEFPERPPFEHRIQPEMPHEHRFHRPLPFDPESLEGLIMTCAREIRRPGRQHFGSTQDKIVRILYENGGTMGQKALQELLHVQPGSISEILSKMEEKGLVTRAKTDTDKRAALISLVNADNPQNPESVSFDALSEEEQETLKSLLKKLLASWKPE
ncbi:MAG: MarR family transcriptional regulator [Solobacterium sp.]|nr:MarR family transcriptional regulator [Solobacterium sp.]